MNGKKQWVPLPRAEVVRAVEGKNPSRIPCVMTKWWGEGLREQYGNRLDALERYPDDVARLWITNPASYEKMDLSWEWNSTGIYDADPIIDDWAKLDEFIEKLPDPASDPELQQAAEAAVQARKDDRYAMLCWWRLFFEKPWELRGMENLMVDYYTETENVHRLHDALCNTYCAYIKAAHEWFAPDALLSSDDLGHQTGSMMSPDLFHELIFPYYKRTGDALKECGMHFWLHSCGDNTGLLDDLIAAGLDVFHPVQKHTMDAPAVAERFGGRIAFLAGIDVQHGLQEKDAEGVCAEVRGLVDTFDRPEGRMCIAAGNGIVSGTPFENIEAFLDEAVVYGGRHRREMDA